MVNGALATVAAGACMPGSRPLSSPATTMTPSTVSAAMVRKSAHLAVLRVLAFQCRGEAKAVEGGKPEQRGKERGLEQK